jgi:hypothetical protein
MSLAMNKAVGDTRRHLIEHTWPQSVVVKNTSFMRAALQSSYSTKRDLTVSIFDALGRASLKLHAEGGIKQPRGRRLAIPTRNVRRTAHGVSQSQRPRNLKNAFVKGERIYQRLKRRIKVMYTLKASVRIRKDVPFYEEFVEQMKLNIAKQLPAAVERAMRTRR